MENEIMNTMMEEVVEEAIAPATQAIVEEAIVPGSYRSSTGTEGQNFHAEDGSFDRRYRGGSRIQAG